MPGSDSRLCHLQETAHRLFLFTSLVVPIINIYVLKEILRFHRLGFQYLFVLSCLALLLPENRQPLELFLTLGMIVLSGYLFRTLFPADKQLRL